MNHHDFVLVMLIILAEGFFMGAFLTAAYYRARYGLDDFAIDDTQGPRGTKMDAKLKIAHHHLDCSVCREILREIPSFFGMFFIDWYKAMWDDQANMRPW